VQLPPVDRNARGPCPRMGVGRVCPPRRQSGVWINVVLRAKQLERRYRCPSRKTSLTGRYGPRRVWRTYGSGWGRDPSMTAERPWRWAITALSYKGRIEAPRLLKITVAKGPGGFDGGPQLRLSHRPMHVETACGRPPRETDLWRGWRAFSCCSRMEVLADALSFAARSAG